MTVANWIAVVGFVVALALCSAGRAVCRPFRRKEGIMIAILVVLAVALSAVLCVTGTVETWKAIAFGWLVLLPLGVLISVRWSR